MRNLPVIYDLATDWHIFEPLLRKTAVQFCLDAEKRGVYFSSIKKNEVDAIEMDGTIRLVGGSPRWGFEVKLYPPSGRKSDSPQFLCSFYQQSYPINSNFKREEGFINGKSNVLKELKRWQNRPDLSFTIKEISAWMDLLVASGRYWSEREDALPLSPEDAERAKSWMAYVDEQYPQFRDRGAVNWHPNPRERFSGNRLSSHSKLYSDWEIHFYSPETYKLLRLAFSDGRTMLHCGKNIYPSLEELVTPDGSRVEVKMAHSISTFPEIGFKSGRAIALAQPADLEKYIDWLGK